MDRHQERELIRAAVLAAKEILSEHDNMTPRELRNQVYRKLEARGANKELIAAVVWDLVGDEKLVETADHRLRLVEAT